ncbi:erythropoietin receptor [Dendropsophus ebraccatus]|uniref:erythropoietin receptor n=1 Tax=Dendropsophus ebraccatus TaxID=150705 RepID=UPI0038317A58
MPSWTGTAYTMSGKPQALYCKCLVLVMWMALCSGTEDQTALASLLHDVYSVIEEKLVIPFCFTDTLYDLTCFWNSNRSDASSYIFYYKEKGETCKLTSVAASNGSWWHVCHFPVDQVDLFAIDPVSITVVDTWDNSNFSRNCQTEKVVYLEPIKNFTVNEQLKPKGLLIILKETTNDLMSNSLTYQVKYTIGKTNIEKTEAFERPVAQQGYVRLFLHDIVKGTEYIFSIRVKADGDFDGYWSQWTDFPMKTSDDVDVLQVMLYVIGGLIVVVTIILIATYQRRFLKKKVWPQIPSPEHHFKELYTTHKGNFKLWLDQTDAYLTWISRNIFNEAPISTLEVLSELPNAMAAPPPTAQLLPKDSYVSLDETFSPHFPAWLITQRQVDAQLELQRSAEASSQEKTSRSAGRPEEDVMERNPEEVPSVEESRSHPTKEKPGCLTILREDSLNSEEGKQSPGSSFEYTVLETCDGLLSPRTRSIPPRQPLKYAYLQMSESGQESPPPSPNIYQNSICAQLPTPIYSQC